MRKFYTLFILLYSSIPLLVIAQDGHYWTQQYGTKSMLLSGSVIGGVEDLGAVYYNPGRLAQIKNPAFLLSASVYEYNSLSAENALGDKQSVSRSEVKGVPTLAAGTFKVKFLPNHHFAYAIMSRQLSDLSFSYRNEANVDVFDTVALPGNEWFNADIGFKTKANEQWIGLTWSHAVSKKLSIGVTTNFATNVQSKGSNIYLRALSTAKVDTPYVATYQNSRNYDYNESGLLWKIGLAGQFGVWSLGLTIKTPMLRLSGSGNYNYEQYYSPMPGLARQDQIYTTSSQEGLEAKSKTPWAIGFGATRPIGKNKIHFSTEWYSGISKYTLMQAQDHISQSTPSSSRSFILTDEAKSIINAGIGAEIFINQNISGFASFSTDYSSVSNDITRFVRQEPETSNNSWQADFFNFGGGVVLDFKGVDLTLGVTHTGARQTIPRLISFPDGGGGNDGSILNPTETSDLKWDRWRFVFSFSFPFLADMAKKMQAGEGDKK